MTRKTLLSLIIAVLALAPSCANTEMTHKKRYYFDIQGGTVYQEKLIKRMVYKFNRHFGRTVLQVVQNPDDATSVITFLDLPPSILGRGGPAHEVIFNVKYKNNLGMIHSMDLQFNNNFFFGWYDPVKIDDQNDHWKVFLHEVGHGMGMNHVRTDRTDIMYPYLAHLDHCIPCFFDRARHYYNTFDGTGFDPDSLHECGRRH